MTRDVPPFVKRGQKITADLWDAMARAVLSNRLLEGPGIRLRGTPVGTIVSVDAGAHASFSHAWEVTLVGTNAASISPGTVNLVQATLKKIPLGGDEKHSPPQLEWKKLQFDDHGRGFIALEVTCGKKWEVLTVEPVQVADPDTEDGKSGFASEAAGGKFNRGGIPGLKNRRCRIPIAQLWQRTDGRLEVFQIEFFPLQHRVDLRGDAARHFPY